MPLHKISNRFHGGFTLLELLIVCSILGILAGSSLWLSLDIYSGYAFRNEEYTFIDLLYRTRELSITSGVPHGIDIATTTYSIFPGDEFNPASADNATFNRDPAIHITGPQTAVFLENADPAQGPEFFSFAYGHNQKTITIQADGGIVY